MGKKRAFLRKLRHTSLAEMNFIQDESDKKVSISVLRLHYTYTCSYTNHEERIYSGGKATQQVTYYSNNEKI